MSASLGPDGVTGPNGQRLFYPVARAWGIDNTTATTGWKTIQWNSSNKEIGSSLFSNNDERITPGVGGWYFVTVSHGHASGYHNSYYLRIQHSSQGTYMEASSQGDRINVSGFIYMSASEYIYAQVYHSNSSHACQNNRTANINVYHLNGVA